MIKSNRKQRKPSIIFLGSKPASAIALQILIKNKFNIKFVVSSNKILDFYKGKNLEYVCKKHKIKIYNNIPRIKTKCDFIISYMYRDLIPNSFLSQAREISLNFHPALLPRFAGYAIYNYAILKNYKFYGATCHKMTNKFDAGEILMQRKFKFLAKKETALSLQFKTQKEMLRLLSDVTRVLLNRKYNLKKQDLSKRTYISISKLNKMKQVSKNLDLKNKKKYCRAFYYPPYQGAYYLDNGKIVDLNKKFNYKNSARVHNNSYYYYLNYAKKNKIL